MDTSYHVKKCAVKCFQLFSATVPLYFYPSRLFKCLFADKLVLHRASAEPYSLTFTHIP